MTKNKVIIMEDLILSPGYQALQHDDDDEETTNNRWYQNNNGHQSSSSDQNNTNCTASGTSGSNRLLDMSAALSSFLSVKKPTPLDTSLLTEVKSTGTGVTGNTTDEDTKSLDQPLSPAQSEAVHKAVKRHRETWAKRSTQWHPISLAFTAAWMESAFKLYIAGLQATSVRAGILLLSFLYMVFALVTWRGGIEGADFVADWKLELIARAMYTIVLIGGFAGSFTDVFLHHTSRFTLAYVLVTSLEIIGEGLIAGEILSPIVVLVLVVYMFCAMSITRIRFIHATVASWSVLVVYNIAVIVKFKSVVHVHDGDWTLVSTTSSGFVGRLLWYNVILAAVCLGIMDMTRRTECQYRFEFILHYEDSETNERKEEVKATKVRNIRAEMEMEDSLVQILRKLEDLATHQDLAERQHHFFHSHSPDEKKQDGRRTLEMVRRRVPKGRHRRAGSFDNASQSSKKSREGEDIEVLEIRFDGEDVSDQVLRSKSRDSKLSRRRKSRRQDSVDQDEDVPLQEYAYCSAEELPTYFQHYPYILHFYRARFTVQMCIQSLFKLHNETLNVWTEFLPFFIFTYMVTHVMVADEVFQNASLHDQLVISAALIGALIVRPLASGLAHLLFCQDRKTYAFWWSVDYVSICLTILLVSFVSGRFCFYCFPERQVFYYVSALGLFCSTIVSVLFVASGGIRAGSFLLFIMFANVVPLVYQLGFFLSKVTPEYNRGPTEYITYWVVCLLILLLGMVVKSAMIPEIFSKNKGSFDIFGYSHQWWHICINIGHSTLWFGWRTYLIWRDSNPCPSSSSLSN
eukprot:TRINITY_DN7728_c0_g1_i1.p1 TRINITY_DN7728_c0_g1~~TRINITY_DN7728_c0_g1_i1.p1  ORF type:complete len:882 (-),score=185.21 TRINITY_DN7728_c0_g1_i1:65-2464(-)